MTNDLKEAFSKLLISVFPKRCDICGKVVAFDETICDDCKKLTLLDDTTCLYCGLKKEDCQCKKHKSKYAAIISAYYYENSIINGVHNLKFNSQPLLAQRMGADIAKRVSQMYVDIDFDVVTFVPMTKSHYRKRGYNQAELIAQSVAKELNLPCERLLVKTHNTQSQRLTSGKERRNNVYGVFDTVSGSDVFEKVILLIDDVKTSGSTLNECARTLRLARSDNVYAATFAIVKEKYNINQ